MNLDTNDLVMLENLKDKANHPNELGKSWSCWVVCDERLLYSSKALEDLGPVNALVEDFGVPGSVVTPRSFAETTEKLPNLRLVVVVGETLDETVNRR